MIELRAHRDADVEALVALAQRAWKDVEASVDAMLGSPLDRLATPSWTAHHEAVVRQACDGEDTAVVVAEDGQGEIVGLTTHRVHAPADGMSAYGEVVAIAVDPAARHRGVGRALLDRAVADLRARDVPVIMVGTGGDDGHTPARALYESAGFVVCPSPSTGLPVPQHWSPRPRRRTLVGEAARHRGAVAAAKGQAMDVDVTASTQQLLDRHLTCFASLDLDGLMADYADDALVFTPDGPMESAAAIRAWYSGILDQFSKPGMTFSMRRSDVARDTAHITWSAETADATYVFANDTFVVVEGKIARQSSAAHVVPR